jgi:hypothetical protein
MLDAGSTLFERLDTALPCIRKLRCEDFERQPRDPATNRPITAIHKEIYAVGREVMVPRVDCGRQWHALAWLTPVVVQRITRSRRSWKAYPNCPQLSCNTVSCDPHSLLVEGIIVTDSGERRKLDYG